MPSANNLLTWLKKVAPGIKEAELRLLLHLVSATRFTPNSVIQRSFRELSRETGVAVQNLHAAVEALRERRLIEVIPGTGRQANGYRMCFRNRNIKSVLGGHHGNR